MSPLTRSSLFAVAVIFPWFAFVGARERAEPGTFHSQTQDGITVRIEKVSVERIFNEPAWLEANKEELQLKSGDVAFLPRVLPVKQVTWSVSVIGDTTNLGPIKVRFADKQISNRSSTRFFSPSKWQSRLPQLVVDPQASGIETQLSVNAETRISDLFPAAIQIQATTTDGRELMFEFKNVRF